MADDTNTAFPDYLKSADNHNLGNQGNSWFNFSAIGDSIANAPSFAATSILSGLNSFYNTGVKIGNLLGGDFKEQKTAALISGIDSDLGTYYRKNAQLVDTMGFILGSFVSGLAGIKVLNAGQKALVAANEGIMGTNLGLALGLRATKIDAYIQTAASEITQGQAVFSTLGASGAKALASGIYQNVLEGIAFETAVQATMSASPVLEGQSKSDILWNIGMGGLFGGVVGGAVTSARIYGGIKPMVIDITNRLRGYGDRDLMVEINKPANRVIRNAYDLERGPTLDPGDPLYQQQVATLDQRQNRIALAMRADVGELTGGDTQLHRMVADLNVGAPAEDVMSRMLHTDEIRRVSVVTDVENEVSKAVRDQKPADESLQVHYWQLHGEDAGRVLDRTPVVLSVADTVTGDTRAGIMQKIRDSKFKVGQFWDAAAQELGSRSYLNAELRHIWARNLKELPDQVVIHKNDIPVLQAASRLGRADIAIADDSGQVIKQGFASTSELEKYTQMVQDEVAYQLQEKAIYNRKTFGEGKDSIEATQWATQKISKITNVKASALEKTGVGDVAEDYDAMTANQLAYNNQLAQRGLKPITGEENDVAFLPQWAKVTKRVRDLKDVDGNVINGLAWIKTQEQNGQQAVRNVVAKAAGDYFNQFPPVTARDLANTTVYGSGAGLLKGANPGYNDPGTLFGFIGSITQRWSASAKEAFAKITEGDLVSLGRNQEAVIEWGGINQKVSRSAKQWYKSDAEGLEDFEGRGLVSKEIFQVKDGQQVLRDEFADMTAEDLQEAGLYIPVEKDETWNLINSHQAQTSKLTTGRNERAAAQGRELSYDANVFRPIPPDPKDYKFFAFVKDPKVTSQGHTSMIFAENAPKLEELVKKAQQARPDLEIHYKQDTVEFQKARGEYEYDRTLSENYIDTALKNKGIYSDYFIKTDPQKVINEFTQYHTKLIDTDVRENVRALYQPQMDWLEDQAKAYSRVETSRFGGRFDELESSGKNPYLSYIKTGLNLSRINEAPLWASANKVLDEAVSKAVGKFQDLWGNVGADLSEAKINELNGYLQKYGLNTGYYDAATKLLVDSTAPKNELSKFIRGANTILSRLTLGLDPLNALNNAIGANILRGTELTQITAAIKAGDSDLAGKLAALGKVDVTGQGDLIMSPKKLITSSMARYFKILGAEPGTPEDALRQFYKDNGYIRDISEQFRTMLGDLSITGTESGPDLSDRLRSALAKSKELAGKAEVWTGNKHMEEMNRFVSADVMKQLTDLAVNRGLMEPQEALAYINTFVNRVEGNVIASQRPFIMQGPIGQAVGLFQSYQFNLMQQMFRYVSEGSGKDAAMLLGLQGTFYGIQGLPAFQAINQHIIGTASGNTKHIDAYDATYGIAGKQLGDLLLYGLPSNILQTNLYSRGDINPRQVTILPTALNEVPVIGATMKFFGALKDTTQRIAAGGAVWESLLQGIEHNGVSRPLAGLAQTLQATAVGTPMSTSSKGDILFTNDLLSLATLTRLSGGRPLDEAIVNDGVFRIHSYQAYDRNRLNTLAEAIKGNVQSGNTPDYGEVAAQYAARGGRQVSFNRYMVNEIKAANVSQSQKIISQLQNPFAQKVQVLLGGDPPAATSP